MSKQEEKGGILVGAAQALGAAAGKIAKLAKKAETPAAPAPEAPKTGNSGKLVARPGRTRLPRKKKKALKKQAVKDAR